MALEVSAIACAGFSCKERAYKVTIYNITPSAQSFTQVEDTVWLEASLLVKALGLSNLSKVQLM